MNVEISIANIDDRLQELKRGVEKLFSRLDNLEHKVDYDCARNHELSSLKCDLRSLEYSVQNLEYRIRWRD